MTWKALLKILLLYIGIFKNGEKIITSVSSSHKAIESL